MSFLLFLVTTQGTDAGGLSSTGISEVVCGGEEVLKVIKFVMQLLDIVFFIVPIVLIVMISVDFMKNVIASREDDMKKNVSLVIKRIIFCVALFLVDPIVQFTISMLGDLGVDYAKCIEIAKNEDLSQYKVEYPEIDYGDNEANLGSGGSGYGVVGDDSKDESEDTTDESDNDSSSNNSSNDLDEYTKIVYIGDSRFEGMKTAVKGGEDNEVWITKVASDHEWFSGEALTTLRTVISSNDKAIIVVNMGVNDLGNVKRYISTYKKLATTYKKSRIIVVSVNPLDDAAGKSPVKNNEVVKFNNALKSGLSNGMEYCDTYSKIFNTFETIDGIHYKTSTTEDIYKAIRNCL